jgi:sulfur carrier protein
MRIILNGSAHELTGQPCLTDLVRQVSNREAGIAVAVNSAVVPRSSWTTTAVNDGDRIDIVTAVQGG